MRPIQRLLGAMMARLENLSIGAESKRLIGSVFGHPKFDDGEPIITSPIDWVDFKQGLARTTSGTVYELGEQYADNDTRKGTAHGAASTV
jgi:hypothetical protein